ncbi:MAG: 3'(2'),5'-bisphosphate nucleotidase CysQ, partial [Pseudomonadota bacterium]|nr:3'(2'),5'-bisphosphate nucleotidase CysQ [Pseudomonadota bacterium]
MTTAEKLLTELEALAVDAGNAIMRIYAEDFVAEYKDDYSPVTEADTAAEEIIIAGLSRLTPDIPVVAEEAFAAGHSPDISGGRFWLVDPLDGTHEFVEKNGEFTVNIALIEDGRPICGVVHAPALGQTYTGHIETGAYCRDAKTDSRDIRIRPAPRDGVTVVATRRHGDPKKIEKHLEGRRVGATRNAGSSL